VPFTYAICKGEIWDIGFIVIYVCAFIYVHICIYIYIILSLPTGGKPISFTKYHIIYLQLYNFLFTFSRTYVLVMAALSSRNI